MNQSKSKDQRFWRKWQNAGAVETITDSTRRSLGEEARPQKYPHYSVDRTIHEPVRRFTARYFTDEIKARNNYYLGVAQEGERVTLSIIYSQTNRIVISVRIHN